MALPKLSTPAYDDKKYSKGINTTYYNNAIKSYTTQAEKQRATQIGEAQKAQDSALKQAYITKVQNQNRLNEALATSGIRGGATETSNLRLQNTYGAAVGAANTDYTNSVNSINQSIDQNIADYTSDMKSRAEEYRQNLAQARWQADRENALNKYQNAREDYWNTKDYNWKKTTANREEKWNQYNANMEKWNNYYLDKYSGWGKDALKKEEAKINKKLAKAKTSAEKIRWQQALRGIGNRRGVLANQK